MRPILTILVAKNCGEVQTATLRLAVTLELLHTASLVHDDVVDESDERRGQASTNATFGNKVAVLVGDYLLSEALHQSALSGSLRCVDTIARLGGTLSEGEVIQLANIRNEVSTEAAYFDVIRRKRPNSSPPVRSSAHSRWGLTRILWPMQGISERPSACVSKFATTSSTIMKTAPSETNGQRHA